MTEFKRSKKTILGVPGKGSTYVEQCVCPEHHDGTSCEKCTAGYYQNTDGHCVKCPCNGA